ncbi:MAG: sulfite exporter TauE/SafE family protein [Candidatus Woesearchaeota archaeon]
METTKFKIEGMHCTSCEKLIEDTVQKMEGVSSVKVDYTQETAEVTFDKSKTNLKRILKAVEKSGYQCKFSEASEASEYYAINLKQIGAIFGILGILLIAYFAFSLADKIPMPQISQNMSYSLLFLVGLLTGFHCVAMCGGFVVSYTAKHEQSTKTQSHFLYGLGKTLSYTLIGAAFGLLGSIITFTPFIRGFSGIIAGIFLIIFGLNMLNIFPILRKVRINSPPFINNLLSNQSNHSPLVIGLLNGLMIACGPLQAIYIMAAGTGSMVEGAKLLFIFAIGTLPVMLGFGFITSYVSSRATHKILKASGIIVILLGIIMINRGLALTGSGLDANSLVSSVSAKETSLEMQDGYQIIRMEVTSSGWQPDRFVLKKDIPVKWIIDGKEINSCNNAIQVPSLGLKFGIKPGEQIIEFTPKQEGVVSWSCWMGMIPGTFIVKADLTNTAEVQKELQAAEQPAGSCGGACGSPSCGAASNGCGCGK